MFVFDCCVLVAMDVWLAWGIVWTVQVLMMIVMGVSVLVLSERDAKQQRSVFFAKCGFLSRRAQQTPPREELAQRDPACQIQAAREDEG